MHLNDLLFLLPKISFFPNLHPEMFPEYVFERGFTNSASFFTENRGASFSQFPLLFIQYQNVYLFFLKLWRVGSFLAPTGAQSVTMFSVCPSGTTLS